MKSYDYETIDALVRPLMEMMRAEYPNDCKLIVTPDYAQVVYEHIDLVFCPDDATGDAPESLDRP